MSEEAADIDRSAACSSIIGRATEVHKEKIGPPRPYTYSRIPEDDRWIRIVHLEPAPETTSPLRATVTTDRLEPRLFYEALSYSWGDPSVTEPLVLDDQHLAVTTNLAAGLRALRLTTERRVLWIDAICINQTDIEEKNRQVLLMREIYTHSSRTIVWLGPSDRLIRKEFELIRQEREAGEIELLLYHLPNALSALRSQRVAAECPWISRVWVVQEASFSRTITVQCGAGQCGWDAFLSNCQSFWGAWFLDSSIGQQIRTMALTRRMIKRGLRLGLLEALRFYRPLNSTRALDKVYAVVGLLQRPDEVVIDYAKDHRTLYRDIALLAMAQTRSLDILGDAVQRAHSTNRDDMKSWIPDWSDNDSTGAIAPGWTLEYLRHPESDGTMSSSPADSATASAAASSPILRPSTQICASNDHFAMPILALDGSITLEAHFIDRIAEVGLYVPSTSEIFAYLWPQGAWLFRPSGIPKILQAFGNGLQSWVNVACGINGPHGALDDSYITGQPIKEALYFSLTKQELPWSRELCDSLELVVTAAANHRRSLDRALWLLKHLIMPLPFPFSLAILLISLGLYAILHPVEVLRWIHWMNHQEDYPEPPTDNIALEKYLTTIGRTDKGLLGTFPGPTLASTDRLPTVSGDSVVLFKGASMPFVIRRSGDQWRLIGEAYVHGIMYGAAFDPSRCVPISIC
ncbi:unnamed protein product [Zymoseptoria tritici ST99CH_3D1]|nr:unnamed protein product [Zymoseptoria tritici ST99CH_3D1]